MSVPILLPVLLISTLPYEKYLFSVHKNAPLLQNNNEYKISGVHFTLKKKAQSLITVLLTLSRTDDINYRDAEAWQRNC